MDVDICTAGVTFAQKKPFHAFGRWGSEPGNFKTIDEIGDRSLSETCEATGVHQSSGLERFVEDDDEEYPISSRVHRSKSLASISQNGRAIQEIKELQARLSQIESQLPGPMSPEEPLRPLTHNMIAEDSQDLDTGIEDSVKAIFEHNDIKPELIERPWSEFMHKNSRDSVEYAIEVLVGKPDYVQRTKAQERAERVKAKVKSVDPKLAISTPVEAPDERTLPDRIRVNSPLILNVLSNIDQQVDPTASMIILRPYKLLVFHERRIRDLIEHIRFQLSEPWHMDEEEINARTLTLQHMECLIRFIDGYLNPHIEHVRSVSTSKISFKDLWFIFQPGENIFMPLRRLRGKVFRAAMDATPETFTRRYNMWWRITGATGGRPDISKSQDQDCEMTTNPFKVNCYYIDFDGKFFLPITHAFEILPYKGEREITDLDFFPTRYLPDGEALSTESAERGIQFFRAVADGYTHFYYSGLTMVTQPCGCPLQADSMHQEYVESEVIVDFKTTLLRHPSWTPKQKPWQMLPRNDGELQERCPVRYYADDQKAKLVRIEHDYVHDDYPIDKKLAKIFVSGERIFAPIPSGWASNAEMVPERDIGLTAGRSFAFVLRTRSFAPLWVWALSPIKSQKESLNNLQLRDNSFKGTIQKLVSAHFKQTQQTTGVDYDIIQGKGRGLIILLHGAPGVGKTSTAESVAAAIGKPLFQITSADLGMDPASVERALKEIFRYAQIWNCVLLLDECDVFLAQRSKNDVLRNGLVSVFLRTLEFYTGVLFLTTNRVGVLDEAIKSRLTYTEYYPPLNKKQTKDIWEVNLRLIKERNKNLEFDRKAILDWAREHFETNEETHTTWNGRQIQQAFKVATALADWDESVDQNSDHIVLQNGTEHQRKAQLLPSHFEVIAQGTYAFDLYLEAATGYNAAERAFNEMVRADDRHFEPQTRRPEPLKQANPYEDYSAQMNILSRTQPRNRSSSNIQQQQQSSILGNQRRRSSTQLAMQQTTYSQPGPPARNRRASSFAKGFRPGDMLAPSPRTSTLTVNHGDYLGSPDRHSNMLEHQDSGEDSWDSKPSPQAEQHGFDEEEQGDDW